MIRNFICALSLLLITSSFLADGKEFSKCELARELARLGLPRNDLPDWVCLARYESNYRTTATNTNRNKTKDWGIFQINDRWWCKPADGRRSYNSCNINCDSLLTDDIGPAVTCARRIKKEQGFKAWYGWLAHCQTNKPSVDECF